MKKYITSKAILYLLLVLLAGCAAPQRYDIPSSKLMPYADLKGVDLSSKNLEGLNLKGANLSNANLSNTILKGSNLSQINWKGAIFRGATYDQKTIFPEGFEPKLLGMRFEAKIGPNIDFTKIDFKGNAIVLKNKDLSGSNFQGVELTGYDLADTKLSNTIFNKALLGKASLTNIKAEKADFTSALLNNAIFENSICTSCNFTGAMLNGVRFNKSNLSSSDFSKANLQNASLKNTDLRQAVLSEANLENANLEGAKLSGTTFYQSNLKNAKLQGADLSSAQLYDTDFTRAVFDEKTLFPYGFYPEEYGLIFMARSQSPKPSVIEKQETKPTAGKINNQKSKKSIDNQNSYGSTFTPINTSSASSYREAAVSHTNVNRHPNWEAYMQVVNSRLTSWHPPEVSENASVLTTMTITEDGSLLSVNVKNSSGNPQVDQAALQAIRGASPFPPLPPEYDGSTQTIEYRFDCFAVQKRKKR